MMNKTAAPSWQRLYATALMQGGYLRNAQGDPEGSKRLLRDSLTLVDSLAESTPDDPTVQQLRMNVTTLLNLLDPSDEPS